mmetsp:Transcript_28292/g.65546  ORF Transcript_28292/g.65546 Transcript_28292/m.65546 type:complete len:233 (+) Transcript_28292:1305-2003(+)
MYTTPVSTILLGCIPSMRHVHPISFHSKDSIQTLQYSIRNDDCRTNNQCFSIVYDRRDGTVAIGDCDLQQLVSSRKRLGLKGETGGGFSRFFEVLLKQRHDREILSFQNVSGHHISQRRGIGPPDVMHVLRYNRKGLIGRHEDRLRSGVVQASLQPGHLEIFVKCGKVRRGIHFFHQSMHHGGGNNGHCDTMNDPIVSVQCIGCLHVCHKDVILRNDESPIGPSGDGHLGSG